MILSKKIHIMVTSLSQTGKNKISIDDTIAELKRQILEKEETKELKLTHEDILIKSGIDFINHVKLPMLYKAI